MKSLSFSLVLFVAWGFLLAGCSHRGVDTAKLEKSFATGTVAQKGLVKNITATTRAKNYSGAILEMQKLAASGKLTPAQQLAQEDVRGQIYSQIVEASKQASRNAEKSMKDIKKSLPK